jgi:gliding motility-associated-like protein
VVDTCSSTCPEQSHFVLRDSVVCRNARVNMVNQSIGATHYKWTVNGVIYAYVSDTSYVTNIPGTYTVTLYAYIGTCVDSSKHRFVVEDTIRTSGVMDTFVCVPYSLRLNTHYANSVWSTGVTDSVISVSTTGTYWAQVTNSCGTGRDSFNVSSKQSPLFEVNASDSVLCADQRDSSILTAILSDTTGPTVRFTWSTGITDSAYSSQIIIFEADTYHVMVSDKYCPVTKDIAVSKVSCDSLCLVHVAYPDAFSPNGDGKNDTFHLLHFCKFDPFTMHIYNRWGELVFESHDIDKGWDGKYKGEPQASGVYWWYVSLSVNGRRTTNKSGKLTLFR